MPLEGTSEQLIFMLIGHWFVTSCLYISQSFDLVKSYLFKVKQLVFLNISTENEIIDL